MFPESPEFLCSQVQPPLTYYSADFSNHYSYKKTVPYPTL